MILILIKGMIDDDRVVVRGLFAIRGYLLRGYSHMYMYIYIRYSPLSHQNIRGYICIFIYVCVCVCVCLFVFVCEWGVCVCVCMCISKKGVSHHSILSL